MPTEHHWKSTYDTDGFVVIRQFLPPEELATLQNELQRYIEQVVPTVTNGDAFYEDRARPETLKQLTRIEQDAFFADYLRHPRWVSMAEQLLGESAEATGAEWFNKPPGTRHVTPPHQDNYYFCLRPAQVLTMWLALDEIDDENGCLRYVRGSHSLGIRPHQRTSTLGFSQGIGDFGPTDLQNEMPIHARPGDVLIHHADTIHRAEANTSLIRHRRSFALVFRGASAQRDERAFERYQSSARQQHQELGVTR